MRVFSIIILCGAMGLVACEGNRQKEKAQFETFEELSIPAQVEAVFHGVNAVGQSTCSLAIVANDHVWALSTFKSKIDQGFVEIYHRCMRVKAGDATVITKQGRTGRYWNNFLLDDFRSLKEYKEMTRSELEDFFPPEGYIGK